MLRALANVEVSDASEAAAQALDILNSTDYFALNHYTTLCVLVPYLCQRPCQQVSG